MFLNLFGAAEIECNRRARSTLPLYALRNGKTTMTLTKIIFLLVLAVTPLQAQNAVYVESWKKGNGKIQDQTFTVDLNLDQPKFEKKIKDAKGRQKYTLVISLRLNPANQSEAYVELLDKVANFDFSDANLLQPSVDRYRDHIRGGTFIGVLDPAMQACTDGVGCAPFFGKRVVKVKGFYCIIQVLKYNQTPASISVSVEFANKVDSSLTLRRI